MSVLRMEFAHSESDNERLSKLHLKRTEKSIATMILGDPNRNVQQKLSRVDFENSNSTSSVEVRHKRLFSFWVSLILRISPMLKSATGAPKETGFVK